MDREILLKFLNTWVQLINDENFVKDGIITDIFDNSIAFFSDGKTCYLAFNRIKEIRPMRKQR